MGAGYTDKGDMECDLIKSCYSPLVILIVLITGLNVVISCPKIILYWF